MLRYDDTLEEERPALDKLTEALAKASLEFQLIARDGQASFPTKKGGQISFRFATLESILASTRPALGKHGLAIVHQLEEGQLITSLLHSSGQRLDSRLPLPPVGFADPKIFGSVLSYLRRYALSALLGVAADDEDREHEPSPPPVKHDPGPPQPELRPFAAGDRLDDPETIAANWRGAAEAKSWAAQLKIRGSGGEPALRPPKAPRQLLRQGAHGVPSISLARVQAQRPHHGRGSVGAHPSLLDLLGQPLPGRPTR